MSKKTTVSGILLVLLVLATTPLLGTDNVSFLKWWLMTLVLGIGFYPAAAALFPRFHICLIHDSSHMGAVDLRHMLLR